MKKLLYLLPFVVLLYTVIYFSNPDKVVINEKGITEGIINKIRALIQGKKFWKLQLDLTKEEYKKNLYPTESISVTLRQINQNNADIDKSMDDFMEELQTPEERMAQVLRKKADSIEREGLYRMIDESSENIRIKRIETCKTILPIIQSKLNKSKNPYFLKLLTFCIGIEILLILVYKYQNSHKIASEYHSKPVTKILSNEKVDPEIKTFALAGTSLVYGIAKRDRKDYTGALNDFNKAIELWPIKAEFYDCRGTVYLALSNYSCAISDFTTAIELDSECVSAYFNRGSAKMDLEDYSGAYEDLTNAIMYDPQNGAAYYMRGILNIRLNQRLEGYKDFKKASQLGIPEANEALKKASQ